MRDVFKPGRASKKVRVPDVRDLPCPAGPGNHELVNHDDGDRITTTCAHCHRGWGELDLEARTTPTEPDLGTCTDCGMRLMSQRRWQEAAPEIREQWKQAGRIDKGRGNQCRPCVEKERRAS